MAPWGEAVGAAGELCLLWRRGMAVHARARRRGLGRAAASGARRGGRRCRWTGLLYRTCKRRRAQPAQVTQLQWTWPPATTLGLWRCCTAPESLPGRRALNEPETPTSPGVWQTPVSWRRAHLAAALLVPQASSRTFHVCHLHYNPRTCSEFGLSCEEGTGSLSGPPSVKHTSAHERGM